MNSHNKSDSYQNKFGVNLTLKALIFSLNQRNFIISEENARYGKIKERELDIQLVTYDICPVRAIGHIPI